MEWSNKWVFITKNKQLLERFEVKNLKKINDKKLWLWDWYKQPDVIKHYKDTEDWIKIPMWILSFWKNRFNISKEKPLEIIHPEFKDFTENIDIDLTNKQEAFIWDITSENIWYGHCSTWVWKTRITARIISKLNVKTLIICSWIELLNQMQEDLLFFFWVKCRTISGKKTKQKNAYDWIHIINIDSLSKLSQDELNSYELVIADELDRYLQAPARLELIFKLNPTYLYWLTWTIKLNHVDTRVFDIYFWKKHELILKNFIPKVYRILTDFEYSLWESYDMKDFVNIKQELYADEWRNNLIVNTIQNTLWERKWIVFCEYIEHSKTIKEKLEEKWIKTFMIIWEIKEKERKIIKQELKDYKWPCVLIWSVKCIGRGFSVSELSIWYLTTAESFKSNTEQYVWRILRLHEWKTDAIWYDFVDTSPGMLLNQSKKRATTYSKEYWVKPILIDNTLLW